MKLAICCLLVLPALVLSHQDNCTFTVRASQADDQNFDYQFCDPSTGLVTNSNPDQLTVTLTGSMNECNELEPTLTEQQLYDQLGLSTRPRFTGSLELLSGTWYYHLDQLDSNCLFIQRRVTMEWGNEFCVEAQAVSVGVYNEMLFTDSNCGGFAALTDAERETVARSDYAAAGTSFDPAMLFDPWPLITQTAQAANPAATGYNITNKVNTMSFTRNGTFTGTNSLCYGVGDKFAPPFFIPRLNYQDDGSYIANAKIFAPVSPFLCGLDCETIIDDAITASASDPLANFGVAIRYVANSTCGLAYGGMNGFNETLMSDPFSKFGLGDLGYFLTSMMMHYHWDRPCNTCISSGLALTDAPWNVIYDIGTALQIPAPATPKASSAYYFCQPGRALTSQLWMSNVTGQDVKTYPDDPTMCGEDNSSTSAAFALPSFVTLVLAAFVALF